VLTARKLFYTKAEGSIANIRDAIITFDIPNHQAELMALVNFALKMGEDVTGMPMLLQGQSGSAPDTLGGQLLATNNASAVMRRFARIWDDKLSVRHIGRYYEFLMIYGPEECKGDFSIEARGSAVLVERDIQSHATIQMLGLSVNAAYGCDPKKAFAEACRVQRLDPKKFQYTDEELAKMQQQPPPEAPVVAAAKIRAQTELQKTDKIVAQRADEAHLDATVRHYQVEKDTDRDTIYVQSQQARDEVAAQTAREALALKRELAMMEYANKNNLTLEQVKKELTITTMKLNTQKELGMAALDLEAHKHHTPSAADLAPSVTPDTQPAGTPLAEVPGKAPAGASYAL
jgi:hypothetical protein